MYQTFQDTKHIDSIVGLFGPNNMGYRGVRPRHGTRESTCRQELDDGLDIFNEPGRGSPGKLFDKRCVVYVMFVFEALTCSYKDPTSYFTPHERATAVANFGKNI